MRARLIVVVSGLFGLACARDYTISGPYDPPRFTLSDTAAWSGGTVVVRSASFEELSYLPVIMADAETLAVARAGTEAFEVRLPIRAEGAVELVLHDAGRQQVLGSVRLAGYSSVAAYSPGFDYSMQVQARRNGVPVVLGNGPTGITLAYPTLHRSERITGLRAPFDYYGIGQSFRGDEFVLRDSTGAVGIWELWPAAAKRYPWPAGSRARQGTVLSPTTFLEVFSHWTQTVDTTSPARGYGPFDTEDSWNVHLSPRGDRVVLRSVSSQPLVPVIDMHTGDTAYSLSNTRTVAAAGFTADGSEFYVAGYYRTVPDSLRRRDATTGARLAAVALPDSASIRNLAVDPAGRFVYLHVHTECKPRIVVYDATTLQQVGDLRLPASVTGFPCDNSSWEGMLVVDTAPSRLYVVWNGEPFPVFEFSVLP